MTENSALLDVITRCHRELDELFMLQQEAVVLGMIAEAVQLFSCFQAFHDLHKNFEDAILFVKLDELGATGRWPVALYRHEHRKLEELMARTGHGLKSLSGEDPVGTRFRRQVILCLDRQKTFKGVVEHHQEREEAGMLPELDQLTDVEWRLSVVRPFLRDWENCAREHKKVITDISQSLDRGAN